MNNDQVTLYKDFLSLGKGAYIAVLLLSYMYKHANKQMIYKFESSYKTPNFYEYFMAEFNVSKKPIYTGLKYLLNEALIIEIKTIKKPYHSAIYQLNMPKIINQIAYNKEHHVKFQCKVQKGK